jgi:streptogramin lyase
MSNSAKSFIFLAFSFISTIAAEFPSDIHWLAASSNNVNGLPLSNPQGLAVNPRKEEFIVADALNNRIVIFDSTGAAAFVFPTGENRHNPIGVGVNSTDEIIVSAMDSPQLWIYDNDGQYLDAIMLPEGVSPGRLDIDAHDNIFVVDRANCSIIKLTPDSQAIQKYIMNDDNCLAAGIIAGNSNTPILISTQGNVLVSFDKEGNILAKNGQHGRKPNEFSHPTSGTIDSQNRIWIVDSFKHEIKRFDHNFHLIDTFGNFGTAPGEFYYPVDIKITPKGKLGILEKGANRLQIFRIENGK